MKRSVAALQKMKRKILFISHDSELTGAPKELFLIIKYIDRADFEPIVVVGKDGPLRKKFEEIAETIYQPLYGRGIKYLREVSLLRARVSLIRYYSPDLIYCNTIMSTKWLLYGKLLRIPTICHVHELANVFTSLSSFDRWILTRFSNHFIAASQAVQKYLVQHIGIPAESVSVIHECIEVDYHRRRKQHTLFQSIFPAGVDVIVGIAGRISFVKGTDLFVQAASIVKQSIDASLRVKFLVVGGVLESDKEFYKSIISMIETLGLKSDVIITGYKENVIDYFSMMDIFVMASREDPFPLVNLEAMALSLPVVAFEVGGNREAIENEAGLLIAQMSPEALSKGILQLITDPQLRETLGMAGRKRVESLFDISKNVRRFEEIIHHLAKKREKVS